MFDNGNDLNQSESNDQSTWRGPYGIDKPSALDHNEMANQIQSGKMFATPQASGAGNNDFVNTSVLQIDPQEENAYPKFSFPTASSQIATAQSPRNLPPINPYDDQGKTLPKYRMGIGHRILASVANFANGFAGNSAAPIYVGPGALNRRYYQDEGLRRQKNSENDPDTGSSPQVFTSPESDGSEQTFGANKAFLNTHARRQWRPFLSRNAPVKKSFAYTAINRKTGQTVGSNDGVNWSYVGNSGSKLF